MHERNGIGTVQAESRMSGEWAEMTAQITCGAMSARRHSPTYRLPVVGRTEIKEECAENDGAVGHGYEAKYRLYRNWCAEISLFTFRSHAVADISLRLRGMWLGPCRKVV